VVRNHQAAAFGEPNMDTQSGTDVESEEEVIAEPVPLPTKKQKTVIFLKFKLKFKFLLEYLKINLYFRL
jgi:hypothetical protein